MKLDRTRCEALLYASDHGVLSTLHPERGVDAVPVCFATDRNEVVVPVDLIKPKSSAVLRRTRNLDADPRAVLLCDHWDPVDWSQLWWIRASMTRIVPDAGRTSELGQLLADKYSQYEQQPFADLIVLTVNELTGWSGENERPD